LVHIVKAYAIFQNVKEAMEKCLARFDSETRVSFLDLFEKVTSDPSFAGSEEEQPAGGLTEEPSPL
jgi:hypothetical protein